MKSVFIGILSFFALTLAVNAEDTVAANKSTILYDFSVWFGTDCSYPGKPRYSVKAQPKHGKLSFRFGNSLARNLPPRCKGMVKGLQVIYTPNRGYRGPDSFTMTVLQPRFLNDGSPRGQTVKPKFTVK